jgi:hypothetical protein
MVGREEVGFGSLHVDVMAGRMARGGGEMGGLAPFPSGPVNTRDMMSKQQQN